MKWIGLTGGIACGKSTVCRALAERGFPVVDADEIAKSVVAAGSTGLKSVEQVFGPEIILPSGELDRRALGQKVFGHPEELHKLESILHPLIRAETRRQRRLHEDMGKPLAIYDIPLLFETGAEAQFDKVVVISCTREQQRERLRRKNQWTDEEIEMRIASQIPIQRKEEKADFILYNNRDEQHLLSQIKKLSDWLNSLVP